MGVRQEWFLESFKSTYFFRGGHGCQNLLPLMTVVLGKEHRTENLMGLGLSASTPFS